VVEFSKKTKTRLKTTTKRKNKSFNKEEQQQKVEEEQDEEEDNHFSSSLLASLEEEEISWSDAHNGSFNSKNNKKNQCYSSLLFITNKDDFRYDYSNSIFGLLLLFENSTTTISSSEKHA